MQRDCQLDSRPGTVAHSQTDYPRTKTYLPGEEVTLAEILQPHGYRTASVGKWQLGGAPDHLPEQQGFHLNIGGDHHGANSCYGPLAMPGLEGRDKSHHLTQELGKAERKFRR